MAVQSQGTLMEVVMKRQKFFFLSIIAICVIAWILILVAALDVKLVAYKSRDMEPTIGYKEMIVITERVGNIERGDIVIFRYPADQSQRFIKRVVGLPGEVITIREGRVFVDEKPLEEKYLDPKLSTSGRSIPEYRIPVGSYYVLGDNRDASNDSRYWGPLSVELIYGRVMFK